MLKLIVVQPPYFAGENPDLVIGDFIIDKLNLVEENSVIVFPEYSNAGGLSDKESELAALPRAKDMLKVVSQVAKDKKCYVVINVLESREGEIKNTTYFFGKDGTPIFLYDKVHLPPSEVDLGVTAGDGSCTVEADGMRFAFLTCYDVYFNEQIEAIASFKPDVIFIPGYQRGERTDIIRAQAKLTAFRCNAYVARSSYSMNDDNHGGCSLIASPEGEILKDMGKDVGFISLEIDPKHKYMRTAGFGGNLVRNDDFISSGLRPDIFKNR